MNWVVQGMVVKVWYYVVVTIVAIGDGNAITQDHVLKFYDCSVNFQLSYRSDYNICLA